MVKYIKNTDTVNNTWHGKEFTPGEYHLIPEVSEISWANNSVLLTAIGNGIAVVAKDDTGNADITDVNLAINYLKNKPNDMDESGREVTRYAATDKGWAYLADSIEFTTSKDASVFNEDFKGNNRSTCVIRFYDDQDVEIVDEIDNNDNNITYTDKQDHIDNKCIKTTLTVDFDKDYDIISGMVEQLKSPEDIIGNLVDVRMWAIIGILDPNGIPFDPDGPGTEWSEQVTEFVGGINLKFFSNDQEIKTDGRAGKKLFKIVNEAIPYNQNQMQFIIKHPTGFKHEIMPILEYYRKP